MSSVFSSTVLLPEYMNTAGHGTEIFRDVFRPRLFNSKYRMSFSRNIPEDAGV